MNPELETAIARAVKEDRRTIDQNSLMWALLSDISSQIEWHGERLSKSDWKWIFTAALRKQRMIPGIDGGMVFLGEPTSKMSKKDISDLIELIFHFGSERGVEWTEPD